MKSSYVYRNGDKNNEYYPFYVDAVRLNVIYGYIRRERKRLKKDGVVAPLMEEFFEDILALRDLMRADASADYLKREYYKKFHPEGSDQHE